MSKIFNDPVHGHIELSRLAVRVIDTPQFQRLRDIGQLGGLYYVFPGGSGRRFEHCIGVAHLARTFCRTLREGQPENLREELRISRQDELCVEIAGLCHDLGHGPASHMFDMKFLARMYPGKTFEHEHASVAILDILIQENNLLPEFEQAGLGLDDIHFIKELILGSPEEAAKIDGFVWRGRGLKHFLYEIVANKRNGIDVDKFDYFARDCHMLGITKSFDATRLMRFARVQWDDGDGDSRRTQIAYHVKEAWNIYELFHTRYSLHKRAYQHKNSTAVELMLTDVLCLANDFVKIPGEHGQLRTLAECMFDMHAYWKLGDYIFRMIENSIEPELQPARELMHRLRTRDLYRFVGQVLLPSGVHRDADEVKEQLMELIDDIPDAPEINPDDILVIEIKINYGKSDKDPVSFVTFYQPKHRHHAHCTIHDSKTEAAEAAEADAGAADTDYESGVIPSSQVSHLLPSAFQERYIRVYCKQSAHFDATWCAFERWCARQDLAATTLTPGRKKRPSDSPPSSPPSTRKVSPFPQF